MPLSPDRRQQIKKDWGHFLWMGPATIVFTLLSGQWQFITTFLSVELIQFYMRMEKLNPEHPIVRLGWWQRTLGAAPILIAALAIVALDPPHLIEFHRKIGMFVLVMVQISVSSAIHRIGSERKMSDDWDAAVWELAFALVILTPAGAMLSLTD